MLILSDPLQAVQIANPEIRRLVRKRFRQLSSAGFYDANTYGYMIIVEPGDQIEAIEAESKCCILHNLLDEANFGDPEFYPSFEILEEHEGCYEMAFILNDDGFSITIIIPKQVSIDADLLAMCAEHAVPAT